MSQDSDMLYFPGITQGMIFNFVMNTAGSVRGFEFPTDVTPAMCRTFGMAGGKPDAAPYDWPPYKRLLYAVSPAHAAVYL